MESIITMSATESVRYCCGEPRQKPLIERIPVNTLLDNLGEEGFAIDRYISERKMQYSTRRGGEIVCPVQFAPLEARFPDDSRTHILEYILRKGDRLELKIEKYPNVRDSSHKPAVEEDYSLQTVGGGDWENVGVQATLTLSGVDPDEDITSMVKKLKRALQKIYSLEFR